MKRNSTIGLVAVAFVGLGGAGYAYWTNYVQSPAYSLKQLQSAIADRNRLRFESYVDVDGLTTAIIEEVLAKSTLETVRNSHSGFAVLGSLLGAQAVDGLKDALRHEMKAALLRGVENGRLDSIFASATRDSVDGDISERKLDLFLLAASTASDQMRFVGLGELVREGRVATIGLQFHNELLDTTLTVRLRLEREGRKWRITRPDNLSDVLDDIERLQARRLAEENLAIRRRIQRTLKIGPLTRSVRSVWYDEYVYLRARVENVGTEAVDSMIFMVTRDGEVVHHRDGALILVGRLEPGETAIAEGLFDYNRYIDEHVTLRYGEGLTVEPWAMVFYDQSGRSEEVREYLSWSDFLSRRPR